MRDVDKIPPVKLVDMKHKLVRDVESNKKTIEVIDERLKDLGIDDRVTHIRLLRGGSFGVMMTHYCEVGFDWRIQGFSRPTGNCENCIDMWYEDRNLVRCEHNNKSPVSQ